MSYSCEIAFKTIEAEEVYSFLQKLKSLVSEKLGAIAEDNAFWLPSERQSAYKELPEWALNQLEEDWARKCFTFRYVYLPEKKILGVYGVPKQTEELFDCTVYFQNSCDQDYDFEEWNGVPIFEEIAQKWQNMSEEDLFEAAKSCYEDDFEDDSECCKERSDYIRRTFCYKEIWAMFEDSLYNDEKALYISLFGSYELYIIIRYVHLCRKHVRKVKEK